MISYLHQQVQLVFTRFNNCAGGGGGGVVDSAAPLQNSLVCEVSVRFQFKHFSDASKNEKRQNTLETR